MKSFILLPIFLFLSLSGFPQFFESGQSPASINWKYSDTENFRLIFPSDYEPNAARLLWLLEDAYRLNEKELNFSPKKIEVIVNNHSTISNGFVALAPRRMELFTQPDPGAYPGDRLQQLSIHEMRHVSQVGKVNQGFTRVLSYLTGEQGNAFGASRLPFWLLEGDAIIAETGLTNAGRGRLPSFEKEIKAILADHKWMYSYDKSYFGSYRDFIPDYYRYGFQMAAYAKFNYSEDFWKNAIEHTGRRSWTLSPVSSYLKRNTGANISGFYEESMNHIKEHWHNELEGRDVRTYPHAVKPRNVYSSYRYPHILEDSSIIAVKTGLDIIPEFVRINTEMEETSLYFPGFLNSGRISVKGNRILWDEYKSDPRWDNRSYSILRVYNFETGAGQRFTRKTRYYSPAFSTYGDTIVAVESDIRQMNYLVILCAYDGETLFRIPSPGNSALQSPEWIKGSSSVAAIASDDTGKRIILYDLETETWSDVFYSGFHDIQSLNSYNNYLVFRGSFSGTDDVYALDLFNGELFRLSHSRYGAYFPYVAENGFELTFSEYTVMGYKPVKIPFFDVLTEKVNIKELEGGEQAFYQSRLTPEEHLSKIQIPENFKPEVNNYSRVANLFRFHSWLPFYFDYNNLSLENPSVNPGLSLTSQNSLSTAFTSLAYEYRDNEHIFHTSFVYKGLYPVFRFSSELGGRPLILRGENDPEPQSTGPMQKYSLLSYIPFNLTSGSFITGIQPSLKLDYIGNSFYYRDENIYRTGIVYTEPRLQFFTYLRRAYRDLQPRLGIILDARSLSAPFEDEQFGRISSARATGFVPGLARNQGLKLQLSLQKQDPLRFLFNNQVSFPRGHKPLLALELNKFSADYIFPIAYPDRRLGSIFYLKRIHGNIFFDYLSGKDVYEQIEGRWTVEDRTFRSNGFELFFEYHFLRFLFPFVHGVRISQLPDLNSYYIEGIFSINLGGF